MSILETSAVPIFLLVVLLIGFASACAARLSAGSRRQTVCQAVFFCCLVLIGGVIVASLGLAPRFWVIPAIVFSMMVLMATCEFNRSRRVTVF